MRVLLAQVCLPIILSAGDPAGYTAERRSAGQNTEIARSLVLKRIDDIVQNGSCRQAFGQQGIDLELVRRTARQTWFYNALAQEGNLKFSDVIGRPASPDQTIRQLAVGLLADAFVLGYQDGRHYVRTKRVVLNRGYFEQEVTESGTPRPTTLDEKQSLLLHELLHIVLNKDDDNLNARELCPLRLLTFCSRLPMSSSQPGAVSSSE